VSDLVTFGEAMLRLSPPRGRRLSRADRLDVAVGGAESNVAAAAAALGADATWLSALPRSPLGERVLHALRGEGVDPEVVRTDDGRVGTYYFEHGSAPRDPTVVYDRAGTPIRSLEPAELPQSVVRTAETFLASGITPALSDPAARTTEALLAAAAEAGVTTAFDVNYRSKLWSEREAERTLTDLFEHVDVLFVAERDGRRVFGLGGAAEDIARQLAGAYGFEQVVVTRGAAGALAVDDGATHEQAAFETETVDPVGSGDALVGGYLARRLAGGDVPDALAWGVATAALKRTTEGDMASVPAEAVRSLVSSDDGGGIDR
jgi:2-dehydro-3-deoxygluconokinase